MKYTVGTKAHCEAVQAAADKLMGYPKTATKHAVIAKDEEQLAADAKLLTGCEEFVERFTAAVTMPTFAEVRRHPTYSQFAYPIPEDLQDEYLEMTGDQLTTEEDKLLFDAIDGAKELPPSWEADQTLEP